MSKIVNLTALEALREEAAKICDDAWRAEQHSVATRMYPTRANADHLADEIRCIDLNELMEGVPDDEQNVVAKGPETDDINSGKEKPCAQEHPAHGQDTPGSELPTTSEDAT